MTGATSEAKARGFLDTYGDAFATGPLEVTTSSVRDGVSSSHIRFAQTVGGIPVTAGAVHVQRDPVQRRPDRGGVLKRDVTQLEQAHIASSERTSSQRKTGTPASAVTTPTGSSAGATTVRASVSAITSRLPPGA